MPTPESKTSPAQELEMQATVEIMAELTRWARERPGWVMPPSSTALTVLEKINLPKTRQS